MALSPEEQQQQQSNVSREDRVAECVTMYAVFCTANIPPPIMDEFIDEAYQGCFAMVEDGDVGASPCILETTDLDSVENGSRKPTRAFESPFLGKTDDEIRAWVNEHPHPSFAALTFTILDEDTIKNKTSRIGYTLGDDRMLVTDFYSNLYVRVPVEMATVGWGEGLGVGTGQVFSRRDIQTAQQRVNKGRPARAKMLSAVLV